MRIITGKYKGRKLFSVSGKSTRPTSSYHRAMIFNIYGDFEGKRVLDLYSGTGSLALEALSRGAVWADMVEFASPAVATILKNVEMLGCGESCHVWRKRVDAFLKKTEERWDLIFVDPPYGKGLLNPSLELIFERDLLETDGVLIAEHSPQEQVSQNYAAHKLGYKEGRAVCVTILAAQPYVAEARE